MKRLTCWREKTRSCENEDVSSFNNDDNNFIRQSVKILMKCDDMTKTQVSKCIRGRPKHSHIAWGCGLTPVLLIAHTHASTTFLDAPYIPRCTSRQVNSAIVYIVLGRLGSSTRFRAYRPAEFISLNRRHYQWNYRYSLLSHRIQSWCTVLS